MQSGGEGYSDDDETGPSIISLFAGSEYSGVLHCRDCRDQSALTPRQARLYHANSAPTRLPTPLCWKPAPAGLKDLRLGVGNELGHARHWDRRVHLHHIGHAQDASDRRAVAHDVETGGASPEKIKHFSGINRPRGKALRSLNGKTKPARIGAFCVRHQEKEPCG